MSLKKLEDEVNETKRLLFADRDQIIEFEVAYPDGHARTLKFRRLRSKEWDHVVGSISKIGLSDFSKATQEQLDQLNACYCLALGYASADGLNAQDWLELDDKLTTETCYFKLLDISGVSQRAMENIGWFRDWWGRQNESGSVPKNGKVAP
jgi:hypothetical protein